MIDKKYQMMIEQLKALSDSSRNYIPLLSNLSALIYSGMEDLNWAGFYLVKDNELLLGPFQGKVACVRIEKGEGVGSNRSNDQVQRHQNDHNQAGVQNRAPEGKLCENDLIVFQCPIHGKQCLGGKWERVTEDFFVCPERSQDNIKQGKHCNCCDYHEYGVKDDTLEGSFVFSAHGPVLS